MDQDESNRKAIAEKVADRGRELLSNSFEGLTVHIDDCDIDSHRFWIYIRCPGLLKSKKGMPSLIANKIRVWRRSVGAIARKTDYTADLTMLSSPQPQYRILEGRRYYAGCKTDAWIYLLSLSGGPNAVVIRTSKGVK